MTAFTRRRTLVGAAATVAAAALPAVAEAEPEFIEIIVYDRIEVRAWALSGGPRPSFRIERVNAAPLMREFKERMRADYGIDL